MAQQQEGNAVPSITDSDESWNFHLNILGSNSAGVGRVLEGLIRSVPGLAFQLAEQQPHQGTTSAASNLQPLSSQSLTGTPVAQCTVETLKQIIRSNRRSTFSPVAGHCPSLSVLSRIEIDCDEVYPNIFVGDIRAARRLDYLQHLGVTHVLNVADGPNDGIMTVNAYFYRSSSICYMGIPLKDLPSYNISSYFSITSHFIDQSLNDGGKVLITCQRGISRSSSFALSYMMMKLNIRAPMALKMLLLKRNVCPNDGFLQQLCCLDNLLTNCKW